jgi:hypothetical protein
MRVQIGACRQQQKHGRVGAQGGMGIWWKAAVMREAWRQENRPELHAIGDGGYGARRPIVQDSSESSLPTGPALLSVSPSSNSLT